MTWQPIKTAPRDRDILVRRMNDCAWEHYIVQWCTDTAYPWLGDTNAYPEDRFDEWHEIPK